MPPPAYFPLNVKLNKSGYEDIDKVLDRSAKPWLPDAFEDLANQRALVLDVRHQDSFVQGHIPQSIFIGIDGGFFWVGALIQDLEQSILLVCPEGREEETITRLAQLVLIKP